MHMELQRTNSESIRTHFDQCVKDADHGFLMTSAEGEYVSSLKGKSARDSTHCVPMSGFCSACMQLTRILYVPTDEHCEGETFKIHAAAQANLLELDTGGLDDDSWYSLSCLHPCRCCLKDNTR